MSGMQDIEAAVGDGQCAALVTQGVTPGGQGVGREDFIAEIQQGESCRRRQVLVNRRSAA